MKFLFMYDIKNYKRLTKVHNILKQNGIRTQFSFFECDISKKEMLNIFKRLIEILNENEDKLWVIPINKSDEKSIIRLGKIPKCINGLY